MYDSDLAKITTLPRPKSTVIRERLIDPKPKDVSPGPGEYDRYLKQFGDLPQRMTWGGKYLFTTDSNPPPGLYDIDTGIE